MHEPPPQKPRSAPSIAASAPRWPRGSSGRGYLPSFPSKREDMTEKARSATRSSRHALETHVLRHRQATDVEDIASDDERGAAIEGASGQTGPTAAESNRSSAELEDRARTLSRAQRLDEPTSRGWQPSFNNSAVSDRGPTSGSRDRAPAFCRDGRAMDVSSGSKRRKGGPLVSALQQLRKKHQREFSRLVRAYRSRRRSDRTSDL